MCLQRIYELRKHCNQLLRSAWRTIIKHNETKRDPDIEPGTIDERRHCHIGILTRQGHCALAFTQVTRCDSDAGGFHAVSGSPFWCLQTRYCWLDVCEAVVVELNFSITNLPHGNTFLDTFVAKLVVFSCDLTTEDFSVRQAWLHRHPSFITISLTILGGVGKGCPSP